MIKFLKILLTTQWVFLFAYTALAQTGYEDVLYLKNGSVIHGIIVEQVPNESIKIQTKDKNIFVFKMDEVEKITKEKKGAYAEEPKPTPPKKEYAPDEYTGYGLNLETHIGPGVSNSTGSHATEAFHVINGMVLKGKFYMGGGIGFDVLGTNPDFNNNGDYGNTTYLGIPMFLDLRAFPVKGNISPIIILDYGYTAVIWSGYASGGMLLNTGFGVRFNFSNHAAFNMTMNYKNQQMHYSPNGNYHISPYDPHYGKSFNLQYLCVTFALSL